MLSVLNALMMGWCLWVGDDHGVGDDGLVTMGLVTGVSDHWLVTTSDGNLYRYSNLIYLQCFALVVKHQRDKLSLVNW